jgi:hypothetical protein
MIAMVTYKSAALFDARFGRRPDRAGADLAQDPRARFDVEGYLEYQGRKFVARMDANAYLTLTRAMDLYDLRLEATSATETSPALPRRGDPPSRRALSFTGLPGSLPDAPLRSRPRRIFDRSFRARRVDCAGTCGVLW